MTVLTRRSLLGAAPVALAGAALVSRPSAAHALDVSGGTLTLVEPFRLLDSRVDPGAKYATGDTATLTVPDLSTVHGVILNVTITGTEGSGFVRVANKVVLPAPTSNINWSAAGQTLANLAIVRTTAGASTVTLQFAGDGKTHVVIDVIGYIS